MSKLAEVEEHYNVRIWLLASISQQWQRWVGPAVRKAYKAKSERERIDAMRDLAAKFRGWANSLDATIRDPHPHHWKRFL